MATIESKNIYCDVCRREVKPDWFGFRSVWVGVRVFNVNERDFCKECAIRIEKAIKKEIQDIRYVRSETCN